MKKLKKALAVGVVAMTASTAFASEFCIPTDNIGSDRQGTRKSVGTLSYCDNGDDYWHYDFYTLTGSIYLDGRLILWWMP